MIGLLLAGLLAAAPTDGFLERNAGRPGVHLLPSGVQYRVLEAAPKGAAAPSVDDRVTVHYEGRFLTGGVFDSSLARGEPATFPLKGLIRCWVEVLPKMRVGDDWTVFCPSDTAYGPVGAGDDIPPNTVLAFRIKLLAIAPAKAP
ncbi:MAG: FKBP-type peptidyl-prolyl cis-trans isomerase [Caulobacteraceae bacterium]|nr:FKBP-type peptidyl-prolyl cis-trans isomerase [Caulobacter sp.]RYF95365.1 MAG: FKBP-type peptidyl-prolyl cis-trans isomerase [Caulobacteraceae bacterium]